ncbi:MAG: hypothetical protein KDC44_01305, partial [Phaeodactylibacter sp.]|nr:hypothetical protein [Phaeodactylibacter sp.]
MTFLQRQFLLFALVAFPSLSPAQSLRLGLQSGLTLSNAYYQGGPSDFDPSALLRTRFGLNMRQPLKKSFKFAWAKFNSKSKVYLDYGVHFNFSGRFFELDDDRWTAETPAFEVPLILTFQVANSWWANRHRRNPYAPVWGAQLGLKWSNGWTRPQSGPLLNAEGVQRASMQVDLARRNNLLLVAGPGVFRETPTGAQVYIGLNANFGLLPQLEGTIDWSASGLAATTDVKSLGSYYSLDLQYFFGPRAA